MNKYIKNWSYIYTTLISSIIFLVKIISSIIWEWAYKTKQKYTNLEEKKFFFIRWNKNTSFENKFGLESANPGATRQPKHLNSIHLITCHYNPIKTPNVPQTHSKLLLQTANQGQTLLLLPTTELHSATVIIGVIFGAWKRCRIRR